MRFDAVSSESRGGAGAASVKSHKKLMWILIGAGGGTAAAWLAMKAGGSGSPAPTPQASITVGVPTVGAPQ